ncbi:MAG: hypothetical protein C0603_10200 [Denitrovibrio sp.]|nr:MAG: hypothetical protein C0603_10200 [Denitrovibrio sp.]
MKYRKDIDGLRALAVLPVLFYHAGINLFSGGYVGVDIFFVISGYLITTVIINELEEDRFTIRNFYVRRIRRIFPVLFFILAVVTLIGLYIQMPYEFRNYGKSLSATVFFGSNIYFRRQMGYFESAAETKPLLHTWSLSVEEQFYIFYPIILILLVRYFDKKYIKYITIIFILSFVTSVFMVRIDQSDTFYFLHTRAWELLLGALLALGAVPATKNRSILNILSIAGVAMILYSVMLYTDKTLFPGTNAILPCLGAFLIIYSGSAETIVKKILGLKPIVYIGLISYSLYLWHWPLLSFFNEYQTVINISDETKETIRYGLLILSFVLSVLTHRYIEVPFRKLRPNNLKKFFYTTFFIMIVFCLLGGVIYWTKGLGWRLPNAVTQIDHGHDEMEKMGSCNDRRVAGLKYETIRRIGAKDVEPDFIVFGDSHAGAFYPGFDEYGKEIGKSGLLVAYNGLIPLTGLGHKYKKCYGDTVEKTLKIVTAHDNIKKVILVARWVIHIEGQKGINGRELTLYDTEHNEIPKGTYPDYIYEQLLKTVNELSDSGKEVYIVSNVPEIIKDTPSMMAKAKLLQLSFGYDNIVDIRENVDGFKKYQKNVISVMDKVESETNAIVIHPEEVLLDGDRYDLVSDDYSYYMDGNHLSSRGAIYIVKSIGKRIFGNK